MQRIEVKILIILFFLLISTVVFSKITTIHVFVSLCDNKFQGIVPVPKALGNGKNPNSNLYWGAAFGIKTFFKKSQNWELVKHLKSENSDILDRVLFKNQKEDTYLLAEAYDGEKIKNCIENFLVASNGQKNKTIVYHSKQIGFGGKSDLIAYIGHNGLMEFDVKMDYLKLKNKKDVIILACMSKKYFKEEIKKATANPVLWTNHLMAPEAYTLEAAIEGWLKDETGKEIKKRAANAYNKYQKCGLKGAMNLFSTGF